MKTIHRRQVLLATGACMLLGEAWGQEAMGLPYAEFLGVRVMAADKRAMYAAIMGSGVKKEDLEPRATRETISFPANTFPGGIENVEFAYNAQGKMIEAIAKVPMNRAWERKKDRDARYNAVLVSIKRKYGDPSAVGDNKTEFGVYPRYTWNFSDGSAIVLQHNGPVYGMDLKYINVALWRERKSTTESRKRGNL